MGGPSSFARANSFADDSCPKIIGSFDSIRQRRFRVSMRTHRTGASPKRPVILNSSWTKEE
jgi:hypothetical protein